MLSGDCIHAALRIEPGAYVCSGCGARFERKPVADHLAEMRALLRKPRPPAVPKAKPTAAPLSPIPPLPKGRDREHPSGL